PSAPDKDRPLIKLILEHWPHTDDEQLQQAKRDPTWQLTLIYTLWRSVGFWMQRPLRREDFLKLCESAGMSLTRDDVRWLVRAGVISLLPRPGQDKWLCVGH